MRLCVLLSLAGVVLAAACQPSGGPSVVDGAAGTAPTCRPLDYEGRELRDGLVGVATGGDKGPTTMRAEVGLRRLAADSVVYVTDEATCRRALAAYREGQGPVAASSSVYVFRLATLYVVHAPDGHPGQITAVLDRDFNRVASWGF